MSAPISRECRGYGDTPAHTLPLTEENFSPWAHDLSRAKVMCRNCDREYRRDHKGKGAVARKAKQSLKSASFAAPATAEAEDLAPESALARAHEYIPDPELVALWNVVVTGTLQHGDDPANIIFFGPSGSGKTKGAEYLAALVQLPFTKVDAASMTDPEAWFGTREIIVQEGVSVTKYVPSAFAEAVQRPGVVFIDEMNRVDDQERNVLLPLTDGTGRVTNPLTGEIIQRHPHCFIIMAGNRGLQFTGTSAIDPAFTTRALTVDFSYLGEAHEKKVAMQATGCDPTTAHVFTKFATDSRTRTLSDPDFPPISTREVIAAARLAARGLDRDLAAKFAILNAASPEGEGGSIRQELQGIWNGVRRTREEIAGEEGEEEESGPWKCPTHGKVKTVPAGVSINNKPYPAFNACPVAYCDETEDKRGTGQPINPVKVKKSGATGQGKTCPSGHVNPPGRNTFCNTCGASLK